jgi:hypothetical protein
MDRAEPIPAEDGRVTETAEALLVVTLQRTMDVLPTTIEA